MTSTLRPEELHDANCIYLADRSTCTCGAIDPSEFKRALITEGYRAQNAEMHNDERYGAGGHRLAPLVTKVATQYKCQTLLDYGAGKKTLGASLPGDFTYVPYDPAIRDISTPPNPADMVICGDVLEHVEPECLLAVLEDLQRLTIKCCYLAIATRPAARILPDGRNAHLIVRDGHWWMPRLMKLWDLRVANNIQGELTFIGVPRE